MTQLAINRFELSINGIRHNVFRVKPEMDTPIDAMLDQSYWAHVASKMQPGDLIEIVPEDRSYIAELFVRDAGHLYAKVALKSHTVFGKADSKTPDGYEVKWHGPHAKYAVLLGADKLKDGFVDKAEANAWIAEFKKAA